MARYVLDFEKPLCDCQRKLDLLKKVSPLEKTDLTAEIEELEQKIEKLKVRIYSRLSPWEKVQVSRHPDRPKTLDYINNIFTDFIEIHGDRLFRDDLSIIGGFGFLNDAKVMIVGHQKGKNAKENILYNFGSPHPEGIRKALRLMKLAEKFSLPVISFIDTAGAYPGIEAEERGQALAIATNLMEMSALKVPIIVSNIGEGGSGGALALGIGDKIFMLENSYYSVISPEGCASILLKSENGDSGKARAEVSEALKLTADDLLERGVIDGIIKEPLGGAHHNPSEVFVELKQTLASSLLELEKISTNKLLEKRYTRYRKMGVFLES